MVQEYNGEEKRAYYWGRREHDHSCDENQKRMKSWVADKICISKIDLREEIKMAKGKQAIMWSIMVLMLSASIISTYQSRTYADSSVKVHGEQKAVDTQQTSEINHNTEKISIITEAHDKLLKKAEETEKEIKMIREIQVEVVTILRRLDK